jgi:uncharacterized membrane protein
MQIRKKFRSRPRQFRMETLLYMAVSLALGFLVPQLNRWIFSQWLSPVDKATMSTILAAIASGMITLSGLVFSLLFVLVQFGSVSYSPRITRLFAHAHVLHHSLGIFTATFLYSLMALRTIGMEQTQRVSGLTVWIGFSWLLASVLILARLVRIFSSVTIANVFTALGRLGRRSIKEVYGVAQSPQQLSEQLSAPPPHSPPPHNPLHTLCYQGEPAYITGYAVAKLQKIAADYNVTLHLPYAVGDCLEDGAVVVCCEDDEAVLRDSRIKETIALDHERTFRHDPKYALRLLVDTAIRALSPAINDPTTAVQALDHIESLLRVVGLCNLDNGNIYDRTGVLRVVFKTPLWEDYLQLGLSEIMLYGANCLQVQRRLEAVLQALESTLPAQRGAVVAVLRLQRRELAQHSFAFDIFRQWANIPDREGIGSSNTAAAPPGHPPGSASIGR